MIFVAGGFAIMDFNFQNGESSDAGNEGAKFTGPSIGGGVAYHLTQNIVGMLQYLYDDYGHKNYSVPRDDTYKVAGTGSTLRVALTWQFH
jgi:outer membrane immunogenic protein